MVKTLAFVTSIIALALTSACSARRKTPTGPPPEYERPTFVEWDAGRKEDPLSAAEAEGEWVDDEPPEQDAGVIDAGPTDSGTISPPADAADSGSAPTEPDEADALSGKTLPEATIP